MRSFLFILLLFSLALLLSYSVAAQIVEDTTTTDRYFPLNVGNVWEYVGLESGASRRYTVVGTTVIDSVEYSIIERSIPIPLVTLFDSFFVRLDTSGAIAWLNSIDADTLDLPERPPCENQNEVFGNCISLDLAFGDTVGIFLNYPGLVYGSNNESVNIGGIVYDNVSHKCFDVTPFTTCFIADIGWQGAWSLHGNLLTYARTQYGEWGVERLDVLDEHLAKGMTSERLVVSPNPSSRWIELNGSSMVGNQRIEIFDSVGRRVLDRSTSLDQRVFVGDLSPGVYFVRQSGSGINRYGRFVKL